MSKAASKLQTPVIAITSGDPAGIGPEIIQQALADKDCPKKVRFQVLSYPVNTLQKGQASIATAQAAWEALKRAVSGLRAGEFQAVVTAPIAKHWMHEAGFPFAGHTEFFADEFGVSEPTMCLSGEQLTVALVTGHCALHEVAERISIPSIVRCIQDLSTFLHQKLKRTPHIAIAGLNPHAGEGGAFGREEIELINPAIQQAQQLLGNQATLSAALPPDSVFRQAVKGEFDGVVSLYHDQGLIPLKLLDFDTGVNTTLGLPIIRTSPDHGTAFSLAGTGKASHQSILAAMKLAAKLVNS